MAFLIKAVAAWCVLVVAAIINGLLRDLLLSPAIGPDLSLPLSGITLSLMILLLSYFLVPLIVKNRLQAVVTGLLWVMFTLSFEYMFGYHVLHKSWVEINQVFNLGQGNLFVVALFASAVAPWLVARIRGIR